MCTSEEVTGVSEGQMCTVEAICLLTNVLLVGCEPLQLALTCGRTVRWAPAAPKVPRVDEQFAQLEKVMARTVPTWKGTLA